MAANVLHTEARTRTTLCMLVLLFLTCIAESKAAVLVVPVGIQPLPAQTVNTGVMSPLGVSSMGVPAGSYGVSMAAGMPPTGQAYGNTLMPAQVPAVQPAAGVIVTDSAGMQNLASGAGPIVAVDAKLLNDKHSSAATPEPAAPPPPEEPAPAPDDPPAERSDETPGAVFKTHVA